MESTSFNFFGVNIEQEDDKPDCAAFQTAEIPPELESEMMRMQTESESFLKKADLPLPLIIVKIICWFGWFVVLIGTLKSDVSFMEGYRNAPVLHWIGVVCFILWLGLFLYGRNRMKQMNKSTELAEHIQDSEKLFSDLRQALGVPEDALEMDVLGERYVLKDGKPHHKDAGLTKYLNISMAAFVRDGNLCLADTMQRWEIPLSSIRSMTLIKKRISFPEWHKDEPFNSPKYKPYKITSNSYGHFFSYYYRIEIRDTRGDFHLLIPHFDGEVFTELTHIRPEESK
ncbi:MAG: hypothetical protein IJ265_05495 [Oscillospiraceae bacterium]|nr:hypothetical protein [Oscillospiraceae bacterium]